MGKMVSWIAAAALLAAVGVRAEEPAAAPDPVSESLRKTELAFAKSVADGDFERFLSFIADDAVFTGGGISRGREAIGKDWSVFFGEGAIPITWHPETVAVLAAGDLGLSTGPYEMVGTGKDGSQVRRRGTFFSVWRRQADGSWKIVLDGGTDPVAEPMAADGAGGKPGG
jgi:ketosteroid isomerase-like protein